MNDHAVMTVAGASRLLRSVEHAFEGAAAAWRMSFIRRRLDHILGAAQDRPEEYVRLMGCVAICAAATHVASAGVDSIWAVPGSGWGWPGVTVLGIMCVRRPEAVMAAWTHSRFRKMRK